jgi:hypothetical protein
VKVSDGRAVSAGLAGLLAVTALLLLVFGGPDGRRAVLVSAAVALVVQTLAYAMVRNAPPRKLFVAWGAAATLRFLTLVVYALVLLEPLKLPAVPALVSLAALFFVTTVLESLLFKS